MVGCRINGISIPITMTFGLSRWWAVHREEMKATHRSAPSNSKGPQGQKESLKKKRIR
jgi:hypothetical protein